MNIKLPLAVKILIETIVCLVVILAIGLLGTLPTRLLKALMTEETFSQFRSSEISRLVSIAISVFMIALHVLYSRFVQKRSLDEQGFKRNAILPTLSGAGLGFLMIFIVVLAGMVLGVLRFEGVVHPFMVLPFFLWVLQFFVEGLREEVLCRSFFMLSLHKHAPRWLAILVNSLAFGLLHFANPELGILPIVNLVLFGVFASIYFFRTRNIWAVGAFHAMWNIAQGNIFGITVSGALDELPSIFKFGMTSNTLLNGGAFGLEDGLLITLVLVVGIILVAGLKGKKPTAQEGS
ncbi:MAG: CPBP family intramembrane metalloprotease [Spirochaetaceae bacterium]|nr:CPBP family intramembrane metalloprotease [Spirochaetaceae bacterium]